VVEHGAIKHFLSEFSEYYLRFAIVAPSYEEFFVTTILGFAPYILLMHHNNKGVTISQSIENEFRSQLDDVIKFQLQLMPITNQDANQMV
jgi:hypothetical protein